MLLLKPFYSLRNVQEMERYDMERWKEPLPRILGIRPVDATSALERRVLFILMHITNPSELYSGVVLFGRGAWRHNMLFIPVQPRTTLACLFAVRLHRVL